MSVKMVFYVKMLTSLILSCQSLNILTYYINLYIYLFIVISVTIWKELMSAFQNYFSVRDYVV